MLALAAPGIFDWFFPDSNTVEVYAYRLDEIRCLGGLFPDILVRKAGAPNSESWWGGEGASAAPTSVFWGYIVRRLGRKASRRSTAVIMMVAPTVRLNAGDRTSAR